MTDLRKTFRHERRFRVTVLVLILLLAGCSRPGAQPADRQEGTAAVAVSGATATDEGTALATETSDRPALALTPAVVVTKANDRGELAARPTSHATGESISTAESGATPASDPAIMSTPTQDVRATARATATAPRPAAPVVRSFTVQPTTVTPGDEVALSWDAAGETVELCLQVPFQDDLITRTCEPVEAVGRRDYVLEPMYRTKVVLLLRAAEGSEAVNESREVELVCPPSWWFFAEPPESCPALDAIRQQAAAQRFEQGTMIWLPEPGVYYVLYDDGTYREIYDPLEVTGDGPAAVGEPPAGRQAPVSGFGLLWRGEVAAIGALRERLGWAVASEFNYEAVLQPEAADRFARLFLRGPEGDVLVLQPTFLSWSVWQAAMESGG